MSGKSGTNEATAVKSPKKVTEVSAESLETLGHPLPTRDEMEDAQQGWKRWKSLQGNAAGSDEIAAGLLR